MIASVYESEINGEIDQEYWSTWPRSYGIHNQQYFTHHKVKDGSYVSKMKLPNSDKKLKERKQNKKTHYGNSDSKKM